MRTSRCRSRISVHRRNAPVHGLSIHLRLRYAPACVSSHVCFRGFGHVLAPGSIPCQMMVFRASPCRPLPACNPPVKVSHVAEKYHRFMWAMTTHARYDSHTYQGAMPAWVCWFVGAMRHAGNLLSVCTEDYHVIIFSGGTPHEPPSC